MRRILFILALCVVSVGALCGQQRDSVALAIERMTLEQKAARLLIVGVDGVDMSPNSQIARDVERGVAGIILFEKNIAPSTPQMSGAVRLQNFISDIQNFAPYPLLISIDQEGGAVNRLKSKYGFPHFPSQREVGSAKGEQMAHSVARQMADELHRLGVNLNFSPCVDVDVNPSSPIVGGVGRSFSADARRVSHLAQIYAQESRTRGVMAAIKHFPGHGSSQTDSHLGLTDITGSWQRCELQPYFDMVAEDACDMVMVSHLYNAHLDSIYPATLSRQTIEWLLRHVVGWQGVVVSDDMQMRAIVDHYGFSEAITLGINAGVDLFIVSGNLTTEKSDIVGRFITAITSAVHSGQISEHRLDQSLYRILSLDF